MDNSYLSQHFISPLVDPSVTIPAIVFSCYMSRVLRFLRCTGWAVRVNVKQGISVDAGYGLARTGDARVVEYESGSGMEVKSGGSQGDLGR